MAAEFCKSVPDRGEIADSVCEAVGKVLTSTVLTSGTFPGIPGIPGCEEEMVFVGSDSEFAEVERVSATDGRDIRPTRAKVEITKRTRRKQPDVVAVFGP